MSPVSTRNSFAPIDWFLFISIGVLWGASFWLIKLGLVDFSPAAVGWLRIFFGVIFLSFLPGARKPLKYKRDKWQVMLLGTVWMAIPLVLFPLAEQSIDSSLAGMLNSAAPLFTVIIGVLAFSYRPTPITLIGLVTGFIGVAAVTAPSIQHGAHFLDVMLVLLATLCYGLAFNLSGPLQQRNGALAVIYRAQWTALVLLTPFSAGNLIHASPGWQSMTAMLFLGAFGTGIAFAFFVTLAGKVGAARASATTYLIPVVAILLGVLIAGEKVHPIALFGILLVLVGAWLTSLGKGRT